MIFENVQKALAEQFEMDAEAITMDTNLIDDLGADSLDVVELITVSYTHLTLPTICSV